MSEHVTDMVLSLRDGQVWASWRKGHDPVLMGEYATVIEEMRTFIAQSEAAEILLRKVPTSTLA